MLFIARVRQGEYCAVNWKWYGGKWLCGFSVFGGSENIHESIILDRLPSARNLDINVQNVHSYTLESVVGYYIVKKYEIDQSVDFE